MSNESAFKHLIGRTIDAMDLLSDGTFEVISGGKTFVYKAVGDCCSLSRFTYAGGYSRGVLKSAKFEEGKSEILGEYDHLRDYRVTLTLADDDGDEHKFMIGYNNISNGYYGGYLEYRERQ